MRRIHRDSRPHIAYPTRWAYSVIGVDRSSLERAIAEVVADRSHSVSLSNVSSRGRYVSLKLELIVLDETERLHIFHSLRDQPAVKIVL